MRWRTEALDSLRRAANISGRLKGSRPINLYGKAVIETGRGANNTGQNVIVDGGLDHEIIEGGGLAPTLAVTVRSVAGEKYETLIDHELGPLPDPIPAGEFDEYDPDEVPF